MREKYESLAVVDLKAIAKSRGIKGTSLMKKDEVITAMLELDEKENNILDRHAVDRNAACGLRTCGKDRNYPHRTARYH